MDLIPIWKKIEFYKGTMSKNSLIYKLPKELIFLIINFKITNNIEITLHYHIDNKLIKKNILTKPNTILFNLFKKIIDKTEIRWKEIYLGKNKCNCNICPFVRHKHLLGTINIHENTYYCGNINKKIYEV